jgi:RNA polymerase sigma-70 factor (ECF subfamily)
MAIDPQNNYGESELISQICAGEKDLFCALIEPYERTVFSIAYSILNNAADAEEVAQEVFLKAFRGLANFRAEAKFSTWLIQITLNEARLRLRRSRPHFYAAHDTTSANEDDDYVPRDFADWREIPSEALERKELRQTIERTLQALPPIYREVLTLRDLQHLSIAETSEVLNVSEALVKTRLRRARLQMREALAPGYDGSWTTESKEPKGIRPW